MHTLVRWCGWTALACSCWLLSVSPLAAQPVPPAGGTQPPTQTVDDLFPRAKLVYYVLREGRGWKEVEFFDLTEWTIEKDVYLDYGWTEVVKPTQRPLLPSGERDYSLPETPRRIWRIRYEAAATEGQSRLFITGIQARNGQTRIYSDDDFVSFIQIPDTGWYELGADARFMRYLQQQRFNAPTQIQTRSQ